MEPPGRLTRWLLADRVHQPEGPEEDEAQEDDKTNAAQTCKAERAAIAVLAEVDHAAAEGLVFQTRHRDQEMMREVHAGRIGSHMPPILPAVDKTYPKGLLWLRRDLRTGDHPALPVSRPADRPHVPSR